MLSLLSLFSLTSCDSAYRVVQDFESMYIGSYAEVETKEGDKIDYHLCLSFKTGEEISEGKKDNPQYDLNLNSKDMITFGGVESVRYCDVSKLYNQKTKGSLRDFILSGGGVEIFTSIGVYDSAKPMISDRHILYEMGKAYSLSVFAVEGQSLKMNTQFVYREEHLL